MSTLILKSDKPYDIILSNFYKHLQHDQYIVKEGETDGYITACIFAKLLGSGLFSGLPGTVTGARAPDLNRYNYFINYFRNVNCIRPLDGINLKTDIPPTTGEFIFDITNNKIKKSNYYRDYLTIIARSLANNTSTVSSFVGQKLILITGRSYDRNRGHNVVFYIESNPILTGTPRTYKLYIIETL